MVTSLVKDFFGGGCCRCECKTKPKQNTPKKKEKKKKQLQSRSHCVHQRALSGWKWLSHHIRVISGSVKSLQVSKCTTEFFQNVAHSNDASYHHHYTTIIIIFTVTRTMIVFSGHQFYSQNFKMMKMVLKIFRGMVWFNCDWSKFSTFAIDCKPPKWQLGPFKPRHVSVVFKAFFSLCLLHITY